MWIRRKGANRLIIRLVDEVRRHPLWLEGRLQAASHEMEHGGAFLGVARATLGLLGHLLHGVAVRKVPNIHRVKPDFFRTSDIP